MGVSAISGRNLKESALDEGCSCPHYFLLHDVGMYYGANNREVDSLSEEHIDVSQAALTVEKHMSSSFGLCAESARCVPTAL